MADARALLKAKRLERGAASKPTARTAAPSTSRLKDDEQRKGKRKLESRTSGDASTISTIATAVPITTTEFPGEKRRRIEESDPGPVDETGASGAGGFPADFFSDPSRNIPIGDDGDDDDNNNLNDQNAPHNASYPIEQSQPTSSSTTQAKFSVPSIDDEFAAFERAIQAAAKPPKRDAQLEAFANATIAAEPELITETSSGFPPSIVDESQGEANKAGADALPEEEETEIDERKRKGEEERELIMDRLMDEERAQEDADAKVSALKARLEAIKLKRAAKKAGS